MSIYKRTSLRNTENAPICFSNCNSKMPKFLEGSKIVPDNIILYLSAARNYLSNLPPFPLLGNTLYKRWHRTGTYWSKVGERASARSVGLCLDLEAASNTVLSRALDIRSPALLLTAEYIKNVTAKLK